MAEVGSMTVRIGASIIDLQAGLARAKAEAARFAIEIAKIQKTISAQATSTYFLTSTEKTLASSTTKAKSFGMTVKELNEIQKNTFKGFQMSFTELGRKLGTMGREISFFVGLPLAGIGIAAVLSSDRGKRAFESMKTSIKGSFADLGATLSKDMNLEGVFSGIAESVKAIVDGFRSLPDPMRKLIEYAASFAIALGPVLFISSQLLRLYTAMGPLLKAFGGMLGIASKLGALGAAGAAVGTAVVGYSIGNMLAKAVLPGKTGQEQDRDITRLATALLNAERETRAKGIDNNILRIFPRLEDTINRIERMKPTPQIDITSVFGPGAEARIATGEVVAPEEREEFKRRTEEYSKGLEYIQSAFRLILGENKEFERQIGETTEQWFTRMRNGIRDFGILYREEQSKITGKEMFGALEDQAKIQLKTVDSSLAITRKNLEDYTAVAQDRLRIITKEWELMNEKIQEGGTNIEENSKYLDVLAEKVRKARDEFEALQRATSMKNLRNEMRSMVSANVMQGGGMNLVEGERSALLQKYEELAMRPENLGLGGIRQTNDELEKTNGIFTQMGDRIRALSSPLAQFAGMLQTTTDYAKQVAQVMFDAVSGFSAGVGQAIAQVIVYGGNLSEALSATFKQLAANIIASLIQIAVQLVITQALLLVLKAIGIAVGASIGASQVGAGVAAAGVWAYAAAIEAMGLIGIAAGVPIAAGAMAVAGGIGAAGKALGGGLFSAGGTYDEGGIFSGGKPALFMSREPEIALTQENVDRFFGGRLGSSSRPIHLTVPVEIDGREVGRAAVRYGPDELRRRGIS